jgi:hypothetical protein
VKLLLSIPLTMVVYTAVILGVIAMGLLLASEVAWRYVCDEGEAK